MTPSRFVWLAMGVFAAGFGALAVLRHRAFGSGRFDLGNMTQAVWSTADGDLLSVTDVHGEQISRLGAHFDPILAALAPLWWLWPSPELLLVVQACAVAAGALPVFWLARAHLDSERPAAALAVAYLLYPPVQWLTASDFHPVSLACPLLLFAWWFLDERRLLPFALCAAAALATKEHVGLTIAAMGVWYAIRYRAPRTGAAVAIAAGSVALLAALVVVPYYAPAGVSAFESRYDSPSLDGRDLSYLAALFLPLGLLPFAAPLALLAGTARARAQPALEHDHADVGEDALRGDGDPCSARGDRLRRRPRGRARRLRRSARGARRRDRARPVGRVDVAAGAHDAAARRALAVVPDDAPVSATNALGAHLSDRQRIFSFPVLREAEWVVVDSTRLTFLDSLEPGRARPALAALRRDPDWRLVFAEDGVLVFRRRSG